MFDQTWLHQLFPPGKWKSPTPFPIRVHPRLFPRRLAALHEKLFVSAVQSANQPALRSTQVTLKWQSTTPNTGFLGLFSKWGCPSISSRPSPFIPHVLVN